MSASVRTVAPGIILIPALAALAAATGASATTVIRVDMQPNAAFGGRAPVDFTGVESQAAAADPAFGSNGANAWNYLGIDPASTYTTNPSFSGLVDSTGATTSVGIAFIGSITAADDGPIDNSGSDGVENDYFIITQNAVTYSITGLPGDTRIAFYAYSPNFSHDDSGDPVGEPSRGYTLTANGETINVPSGYGVNNALAFVTTDALGDISGTWSTAGNEGNWSGFQLAYGAAPEPASWAMMLVGCAGAGLAMRRRRQQITRLAGA